VEVLGAGGSDDAHAEKTVSKPMARPLVSKICGRVIKVCPAPILYIGGPAVEW
jgi:hypothetical protein